MDRTTRDKGWKGEVRSDNGVASDLSLLVRKGGGTIALTFYYTIDADSVRAYMPAVPVLLPASSFARRGLRAPKLPDHITERAADCGGFVATRIWGDYRYTPNQYVDWLSTWNPCWAATMDYCCEDEITAGKPGLVHERQDRTTEMAWRFFTDYRDAPWAWVPTVQGWEVEDYRRHARQLTPLLSLMRERYAEDTRWRVGVGTLCQRASPQMIRDVARAVSDELPGIPLHLWGIKLQALQSWVALPEAAVSCDSAAWHGRFGRDMHNHTHAGMTQREYAYKVGLPRYAAKVEAALSGPKQTELNL